MDCSLGCLIRQLPVKPLNRPANCKIEMSTSKGATDNAVLVTSYKDFLSRGDLNLRQVCQSVSVQPLHRSDFLIELDCVMSVLI